MKTTSISSTRVRFRRYRIAYLMLLPGFIVTGIFSYAPLYGLWMAFSSYQLGKPILSAPWVGFRYFREVILDSLDMLSLLRNTIAMNFLSLIAVLGGALLLAIMLNEVRVRWFKRIVQTASFFPFFISWVIVYNIFNVFLAVESGVLNVALRNIGILKQGINFLAEARYAWGLIVATNLWKSLGYNSVIFLAAISGIEQDMYEAAEIDGADRLQRIWHITLPGLMPTLQVLLILNVGWLFSSNFDQYYLFTNGLNRPMMEVFDMYIYRFGLKLLKFSYATTVGIVKSVAGVVTLTVVNMISKRTTGKGIL
jgi:putative aldouronate transport system permease protein